MKINNLAFADYCRHPGVNCSSLKQLAKSPAHYATYQKFGSKQTAATGLGTLFHALVLEPLSFDEEFSIIPACDKRTMAGKLEFKHFTEQNLGKTLVDAQTLSTACQMRDSLLSLPFWGELRGNAAECEVSFFSTLAGVEVKARADMVAGNRIIDLKTAEDASPKGFYYAVRKYEYSMQAAFYLDVLHEEGYDIEDFIFVAVEKVPPYCAGFYRLNERELNRGRELYQACLARYIDCELSNEWPGYNPGIVDLPVNVRQQSEKAPF